MLKSFFSGRVIIKIADITTQRTDALVNAANPTLSGGSGVDGAIHQAGGALISEECAQIRSKEYPDGLPAGKAVLTNGGNLKARFVIHAVGPVYGKENGREMELLKEAYLSCLKIAREKNINSITFPALSTGAYGYPKDQAAVIVSRLIKSYIEEYDCPDTIDLVFLDEKDFEIFIINSGW